MTEVRSACSSSSSSRSSSSTSSCSSAQNENGFYHTSVCLRSILMHPIGLLLASHLNEVPLSDILYTELLWTDLSGVVVVDKKKRLNYETSRHVHDTILSSTMVEWNTTSKNDLTAAIKKKIDNEIEKKTLHGYGTVEDEALLTIEKEIEVGDDQEEEGHVIVDFVISKQCIDDENHPSKRSVVMTVQFGGCHNKWWQLMNQNQSFVKFLTQNNNKGNDDYRMDQPLLLTVVTMNKPSPNDTSNKEPIARFGVFLCLPNTKNECALLWRMDTFHVDEASKQFGKILDVAQRCADWREHRRTSYEYLGPDCCRIGEYLYRSYDNRLRPIERRPDLYETEDTELFGTCHSILKVTDDTNEAVLHPFGQQQLPDDIEPINWLWAYRGQLKIIATRFHVGLHYATRPEHFLPIVQHLEDLHSKHYVHGDIRAYNMVLKYDGTVNDNVPFGRLIDFDYGGKVETTENLTVQYPKYPSGYVDNLFDGVRPGRPGEDITFEDDWRALGSVILDLYYLTSPFTIPEGKSRIDIVVVESLLNSMRNAFLYYKGDNSFVDRMQDAFTYVGEECSIHPDNPGPFLRAYLDLALKHKFFLTPTGSFERDLEECNMLEGH